MTLDFVIVHDYPAKYRVVRSQRIIELAMDIAEIPHYQIHETEESSLTSRQLQGQPFPEGAVLYVHGNVYKKYQNVGLANQFSRARPDLKFILQIDDAVSSEHDFSSRTDYELVRVLSKRQHASQSMICCDLNFFVADQSYWLATYLQELKQLRGL